MATDATGAPNVKQAVPFFNVTDIEASLRFYVDGLGFVLTNQWVPEGRIRWCWLRTRRGRGDASGVLARRTARRARPDGPLGQGVSICFMCADAIWRSTTTSLSRGIAASTPVCRQRPVGDLGDGPGRLPALLRKPDGRAGRNGLLGLV